MYKGVIYKITHRETGRVYIGQTRNFKKRIQGHKDSAANKGSRNEGQPIVKAIREFGFDAFEADVVYESPFFENLKTLKAHLNEMEIHYISKYNSIANGYNLTKGGGGLLGYRIPEESIKRAAEKKRGQTISQEHKDAVGRAARKMWKNEEYRKMMSEKFSGKGNPMYGVRLTGEKNHNYGKPMPEEVKKKLSIARRGKGGRPMSESNKAKLMAKVKGIPKSEEHRKKLSESLTGKANIACWKPILQYSLSGDFIREWSHVSEAQDFYKNNHISDCALGKRNQTAGYFWVYKTGDDYPKKVIVPSPKGNRRIAQIDSEGNTIREFNTIREASIELNLRYTGIRSVLTGEQKRTGGNYRFKYLD